MQKHSANSHDRSLEFQRTRFSVFEKVWAEEWARENDRGEMSSPILETLIYDRRNAGQVQPSLFKVPLTVRERRIVATVVQWMGTNVGSSFVDRVQKKIDALRADPDRCQRCGEPHSGRGPCKFCDNALGDHFSFLVLQLRDELVIERVSDCERIKAIEILSRETIKPCWHAAVQPTINAAREAVAEEHRERVAKGRMECVVAKL